MSIISLFSGSFCQAEAIVSLLLERTGFVRVADDEIVRRASELSGVTQEKLVRSLSAKPSVFSNFTGERERSIANLRYAVAERLLADEMVVEGFCSHLIPRTITHALQVCLIADMAARIDRAVSEQDLKRKEAGKLVRRRDEKAAAWVQAVAGSQDPWNPDLYDVLIPTDKTDLEAAIDLIANSLRKDVVQVTPSSKKAA
ncbi:MAG: cytidylate kinase family protein, partial [Acidobacteriota bacterium]